MLKRILNVLKSRQKYIVEISEAVTDKKMIIKNINPIQNEHLFLILFDLMYLRSAGSININAMKWTVGTIISK